MKIGLLQCNVRNGDLCGNVQKIADMARQATEKGAELLIASEDAIAGPQGMAYCCLPQFIAECGKAKDHLAQELAGLAPLICGLPASAPLLLQNGLVIQLPCSAEVFGMRLNVISSKAQKYEAPADLVIDLRSRRFFPEWFEQYQISLTELASASGSPVIGVNIVGGYGSPVYQGSSLIISEAGEPRMRASSFAEDIVLFESGCQPRLEACPSGLEAQWKALVIGIRDFIHKSGATKCILGLSGGIDSALVACLGCEALGASNMLGILMPSEFTSAESLRDASILAANLGMPTITLPISELMQEFQSTLEPAFKSLNAIREDLTWENLQARIRAVLLMAVANKTGALVLNTGNLSESAMGYSTLYGDSIGSLAVLGDLLKTRVYELARWRNERDEIIPSYIIEREPSAELRPNQKDSDSLPPYCELDKELDKIMRRDDDADKDILRRTLGYEFKRFQSPPALQVGEHRLCATPPGGFFSTIK